MEGPFVPGTNHRFIYLPDDEDERRLRQEVQEGAPGLYVFGLPFMIAGGQPKCLVEAYEPWEINNSYVQHLDPYRLADYSDGRLVAISTVPLKETFVIGGGRGSVHAFFTLTGTMLQEIRRNNRSARSELRRSSSASARKLALEQARKDSEAPIFKEWEDMYEDAYRETEKFGLGKTRISMTGAG